MITRSEQEVIEKVLSDYSDEIQYAWSGEYYLITPVGKKWKQYHLFPDDKTWCNPKAKSRTYYPYKSISHFIERYVLSD